MTDPNRDDPTDLDKEQAGYLSVLAAVGAARARGDDDFRRVLDVLPAAIYITDINGLITYYNDAAARLWGWRPEIGGNQWCGSWKLYWPDGRPMPHDQCPMAVALRERRVVHGLEAVAERPDGGRVPFMPYPTLILDASGTVTGAVNMLVDITDRKLAEINAQKLAAIVESSDDAIVSKDLNGVIQSWNAGAERLFGYTAEEAIGKPVTILIPPERLDEEPDILSRIRRGERVNHYETVRQRKDGTLLEISLTVSPIRGQDGGVIGASKIARDITERQRSREQEHLLLREMSHRVKNLFTLAGSIVSLSARTASSVKELAAAVGDRLAALARAHDLTLAYRAGVRGPNQRVATLHSLIGTVVSPYQNAKDSARVTIGGVDVAISPDAVSTFALLVHEFTTNAAKYGSLSTPAGRVSVECVEEGDQLVLIWTEQGGPTLSADHGEEGFGSLMTNAATRQLGGTIARDWTSEGLVIRLSLSREKLGLPL